MSEEKKEIKTEKEAAKTVEERRDFLKNMSVAALVGAATLLMDSEDAEAKTTWAEWFQKNYRLMTEEEKKSPLRGWRRGILKNMARR